MKDFLKYFGLTLLITVIMFEGITIGLLTYPKGVFHSSYQSLIQDKYRILIETNEPKIIIVSGSSSAFGLNQKMLEDSTGYKVANLGLHAGFGHLFCSGTFQVVRFGCHFRNTNFHYFCGRWDYTTILFAI